MHHSPTTLVGASWQLTASLSSKKNNVVSKRNLNRSKSRINASFWRKITQQENEPAQIVESPLAAVAPAAQKDYSEMAYMTGRAKLVNDHFESAIGIDDFLHRLEIALYAYGFNGDNSIGKGSILYAMCSSLDISPNIIFYS